MNTTHPVPPDDPAIGAPNDRLAARIATALDAAGLVPPGRRDEIRTGLSAGSLTEADWRLRMEDVIENNARGERDGR